MHRFLIAFLAVATAACTTTTPPPSAVESKQLTSNTVAVAAAPTAAKKPQCYSSESGRFHEIGEKAAIAAVNVSCTLSADGKFGNWSTGKH